MPGKRSVEEMFLIYKSRWKDARLLQLFKTVNKDTRFKSLKKNSA